MKSKYSTLTRVMLAALAALCICTSAFAGPDRSLMFIKVDGQMMKLVPMTKDVNLGNGCTVCTRGIVSAKDGRTIDIKDGELVTSEGKVMSPAALHAHGG